MLTHATARGVGKNRLHRLESELLCVQPSCLGFSGSLQEELIQGGLHQNMSQITKGPY